jgi:hypothetical protein
VLKNGLQARGEKLKSSDLAPRKNMPFSSQKKALDDTPAPVNGKTRW